MECATFDILYAYMRLRVQGSLRTNKNLNVVSSIKTKLISTQDNIT